jgi:hypothetical protein
MICPTCHLEVDIERQADELLATYKREEFESRCAHLKQGSPLVCSNLLPTVLKLLESDVATRGFGPREKAT